jgi:asparagine synthase (glutamine-hydrolysing)
MCGIAGICGFTDVVAAHQATRKMTMALARRGPDGEGIIGWDKAILGHRRLAIIDLTPGGHQPMVSIDRSIGVTFNGEIYNYRELRQELLAREYKFHSQSDTEVLVYGYQEWGINTLVSKLRGMFAFGLWDDQRQTLYLVRDRLGVKPLVYSVMGNMIAFASNVRALRIAGFVNELDEWAVADFLERGYVTDHYSIYKGAIKVPAASIVAWSEGGVATQTYWAPPAVSSTTTLSFTDAVVQTEHLFLDAVKARLRADVPVGVLLSGGIDSALVCWAITKLGSDLTAYTIGVPNDSWDETAAARATAQDIGIEHRVLDMSSQEIPAVEELVSAYAEPFACASALGMLRVSKAISPSAKVLLTGDGGDDVFLGYPRHRHLWIAGKCSKILPAPVKRYWLAIRAGFPRIGPLRRAAALLDYASGNLDAFAGDQRGYSLYSSHDILGNRLQSYTETSRHRSLPHPNHHDLLTSFLRFERQTQFVGEYMTKVDASTMYYGLEARSPFLDQYLWEFASTLPFDVRLHQGRSKALLRELARQKIGKAVAQRRKQGFGIPVQRWIIGRWRPFVEAAFSESVLAKEGWVRADRVLAQLGASADNRQAPTQLWYLFVLECWIRHEKSIYTALP